MAKYGIFELHAFDAEIEKLSPIVSKWEGGFVDDPLDKGGATKMGVTINTWKHYGYDKNGDGIIDEKDVKLLNQDDFKYVLQKYWDKWKADDILNQSVANILVDWYWASGKWGIVIPQRLLGVVDDGIVGKNTLKALNSKNQKVLFEEIKKARIKFVNDIVKNNHSQKRFLKGWLNRLDDFKYYE